MSTPIAPASRANFASVKLPAKGTQVDDLTRKLLKVEADGSLARRVRAVVEENRKLAK